MRSPGTRTCPFRPEDRRTSPPVRVRRNGYESVQVNVDANGNNIVGDAANEPSIAVDPTNPLRMAIGWRQFDTITSDFRQAGWAYTTDGGQTWTFPGVVDPGVFRSDPVLDADADGNFYFYSLDDDFDCQMFISSNGGVSWGDPTEARGGDKAWMAIDRTEGIGHGNIYCTWEGRFTRSTDGGLTYMEPIEIPNQPQRGTLAVGPDGAVYVVGSSGWFVRSSNAQNPAETPEFELSVVPPVACCPEYHGPNPGGLLGQPWVACDYSGGPHHGNVYLFGAAWDEATFARSADRGQTWSEPIRVDDDLEGDFAWRWFGTMSVAPNGRIDVIWNDTRNSGVDDISETFYSYSIDGGQTFAPNVPVTPPWNSWFGWPGIQQKIGDYYDMVSDNAAAYLAYAATFNGEEDVYFLRIKPDCNENGIHDGTDLASGASDDVNGNWVPDECDDCNDNGILDDGDIADGTSQDCNSNSVPDECDVADGTSSDVNGNEIPDECDWCPTEEFSRILASDGTAYDSFGCSLSICGDIVVVGAYGDDDNGTGSGSAYVFQLDGMHWAERAKLMASDGAAGDYFGWSVSISGDTVVVGARGDDDGGSHSGSAYVFVQPPGGWSGTLNEDAKLLASDGAAGDYFGLSVSISGDTVVVGAYADDNGYDSGSAYVFVKPGAGWSGTLHENAKLLASDGAGGACFGRSVSISGDTVVVGAFGDNDNDYDSGSAYVFVKPGAGWSGTLHESAKLRASDGAADDYFGWSVSISGDTVVVGAEKDDDYRRDSGSAYVFQFDGANWTEQVKLLPGEEGRADDRFGWAVAILGDTVVIGATERVNGPGSASMFARYGSGWIKLAKLRASDGASGDRLGYSVAIGGNVAVVGAAYADVGGLEDAGAVYVLHGVADCNDTGTLDVCDIAAGVSADVNGNGVPDECEGPGDLNCDGVVNADDIDPFVLALVSAGNAEPFDDYSAAYPDCDPTLADVNADGCVNLFDIDAFINLLTG